MCDARLSPKRVAVLGVALAVCVATAARAQRAAVYERRLDSLMVFWRAAHEAARVHALHQQSLYERSDTVHAGPLLVLAARAPVILARQAADSVYALLAPGYGRALDLLRSHTFVVRNIRPSDVDGVDSSYVLVAEVLRDGSEAFRQVVVPERAVVTSVLRAAVLRALLRDVDRGLKGWLANDLPWDTAATSVWAPARLSLLSSGAAAARRCYQADIEQCRLALRLREPADPIVELYDASDRRRIVSRIDDEWRVRTLPTGAGACMAGDDAMCVAVLRQMELPDPVSSAHRHQLLQVAIALGGSGAMERLILTPGTPEARLGAAARVGADSVMRAWIARIRSGRKSSDDMSPAIAGFSIGWILVFGAIALASSRWR